MPGKYKDLIMDVATEEMGHVEMIATMVARLLEGAPATARGVGDRWRAVWYMRTGSGASARRCP
jgi:Mn-containing catalase